MQAIGKTLDIGTMTMEVVRPSQGTFALQLDNSKIYTSIKRYSLYVIYIPSNSMISQHAWSYCILFSVSFSMGGC